MYVRFIIMKTQYAVRQFPIYLFFMLMRVEEEEATVSRGVMSEV